MKLPEPRLKGTVSVEEALAGRRSIREFSKTPLQIDQISQLLWSAYGVSSSKGLRTAPSARELYPLGIYLVVENVDSLKPGLYHYSPVEHKLVMTREGRLTESLYQTTFNQTPVQQAAAVVVFVADYSRPLKEFGEAGRRFVDMDIGHSAENLHLQAVALDIGTVVIAAFRPEAAKALLEIPENEEPIYLMPLGKPEKP